MKKLLIVVDYQNDFVDGALGFQKAVEVEDRIVEKIKKYEQNNDEVIYTLDTHYDNYMETMEGKNLPVPHCIKGSYGHKLYGKVEKLAKGKLQIEKTTFGSIDLVKYLENKEYSSVELIGVVSNICVISNAVLVKATLPNTEIIVDSKAIASNDELLESKAIDILRNLHIKVN